MQRSRWRCHLWICSGQFSRAYNCPVLVNCHTEIVPNLCRNIWTRAWLQQRRLILGGVPLVELAGKCESMETMVVKSLTEFLSPWYFTPQLQIFTVWKNKRGSYPPMSRSKNPPWGSSFLGFWGSKVLIIKMYLQLNDSLDAYTRAHLWL